MHIIFVSREFGLYKGTGGIGTYVWDLSRRIIQSGHKCTIICSSRNFLETGKEVIEGVRVIKLADDHLRYENRLLNFLTFKKSFFNYREKVAQCLDELINSEQVDIVEFPEYYTESIIWQRKQRKIPMVIRWHTPLGREFEIKNIIYFPIKRWINLLTQKVLEEADAITFPSKWMEGKVSERINLKNKFCKVIPNGINMSEWRMQQSATIKKEIGKKSILFVGTLTQRKGFSDVIEAVKILRKKGNDLILYLVGRHTQYSKSIMNREKRSILEGWLKIASDIPRHELAGYYNGADICCFPSWFETMPIVCLEAMACGAVVIVSTNSGAAEAIEEGVNGFLVEPQKPDILAECILKIINLSDQSINKIKTLANKKMMESYDNSVIVPILLAFYEEVIRRHKEQRQ